MRYYHPQHIEGYKRIKAEGKVAWGEIHGSGGFEDELRAFPHGQHDDQVDAFVHLVQPAMTPGARLRARAVMMTGRDRRHEPRW